MQLVKARWYEHRLYLVKELCVRLNAASNAVTIHANEWIGLSLSRAWVCLAGVLDLDVGLGPVQTTQRVGSWNPGREQMLENTCPHDTTPRHFLCPS